MGEPVSARADVRVTAPSVWDMSTFAGLVAVLREDWAVNGRSPLAPATQMITVHRFGQWVHAPQRSRLGRALGGFVYHVAYVYVRNVLGFEVEHTVKIGRGVRFFHQHGVVIHPRAEIGDGTLVYQGVVVGVRWEAGMPGAYYDHPRIGAHVRLGAGAMLIGAVSVGDGATVGPRAVVSRDVGAGASVVAPLPRVLHVHESCDPSAQAGPIGEVTREDSGAAAR